VEDTAYSRSLGYGWQGVQAASAASKSCGAASASCALHDNHDETFLVNLRNGDYDVTPTLSGSQKRKGDVALWIDGAQLTSNLSTRRRPSVGPTFRVSVTDGLLSLRIADQSSRTPDFMLDKLVIQPVVSRQSIAGARRAARTATVQAIHAQALLSAPVSHGKKVDLPSGISHPTIDRAISAAATSTATVALTNKTTSSSTASKATNMAATPFSVSAGAPATASEGISITFVGSINAGTGPYTEFWNFGDGTTASGTLTPSHTYEESGSYKVSLCVTDGTGAVATQTVTVAVASVVPTVTIAGPASGDVNQPLTFVASALDPSAVDRFAGFTYQWNFGDGTSITSDDPAPDHTFTTPGTYTVSVTATDKNRVTSMLTTTSIVIAAATVIPIDRAWLASHGPGPYALTQNGATYKLQTDVTTSGTAFVVAGSNITFDLNGHTVTFDNSQPITVPNGGFEDDPLGSTKITDWDTSGAPNSNLQVAPNNVYLFGSKVLKWTVPGGVTTPQVITSANITIPQANLVYTASITTSAIGLGAQAPTIKMEVVDATTGLVESNFNRLDAGCWQGDSAIFSFVPTSTDPVYLRVSFIPPSGSASTTVTLDQAVLSQSMDYGILASSTYFTQLSTGVGNSASGGTIPISGVTNLPPAMRSVYKTVYAPTIEDTAGGGQIVQGQGGGAYSDNIITTDTHGAVRIRGVSTYTSGDSSTAISAKQGNPTLTSGDSRVITHCTVAYAASGLNILRREDCIPAIDGGGVSPIVIENSTIINNPQMGISLGGAAPSVVQYVRDNVLHPNTIVTNGYAIVAGEHSRILNNTINTGTTGSSRGILIQNLGSTNLSDYQIAGNYVYVQEKPNREYGQNVSARAFKIRNYGTGVLVDVNVTNNTFITITQAGDMTDAAGGSAYFNGSNQNIVFSNNTFEGLVLGSADPGSTYQGNGFEIDKCDDGSGISFVGNTIESNGYGIVLGTTNSNQYDQEANLTFVNNTFAKAAIGVNRPFTSYRLGYYGHTISNVNFIGSAYKNGATSAISWGGTGQKTVAFGSLVTVHAADAAGNSLAGAIVILKNSQGVVVSSGATDVSGNVSLDVGTVVYSGTTNSVPAAQGPFSLSASMAGHQSVNLQIPATANMTQTLIMKKLVTLQRNSVTTRVPNSGGQ
jgi:PKD repeat protein